MDYQKILNEILEEINPLIGKGTVADYIPELKNIDVNKFGMYLLLLNDESYHIGTSEDKFSIQSISKVFMLALIISQLGDKVYDRVDVEPSGDPFNSLIQLELEQGIPRNPFINSGALVITDMLLSHLNNPKHELLQYVRDLAGDQNIDYNLDVALSERKTGFKNAAMLNLMKSFDNIKNNVDDVLNLYCDFCSIEMSCEQLAKAFRVFANHGKGVKDTKQYITKSQFKRMAAIMLTCGFYDEAGEFAFRVGLPGKSGVGGGIAAILPSHYSIVVWSPGLNEKGNSLVGMKALELFTTKTGSSIF